MSEKMHGRVIINAISIAGSEVGVKQAVQAKKVNGLVRVQILNPKTGGTVG